MPSGHLKNRSPSTKQASLEDGFQKDSATTKNILSVEYFLAALLATVQELLWWWQSQPESLNELLLHLPAIRLQGTPPVLCNNSTRKLNSEPLLVGGLWDCSIWVFEKWSWGGRDGTCFTRNQIAEQNKAIISFAEYTFCPTVTSAQVGF